MTDTPDVPARRIMIVEDDAGVRTQLRWALADYAPWEGEDRRSALTILRRESPEVVVLDLGLPPDADGGSEGLATLRDILAVAPQTKVIIASGNQDRKNALTAIACGAYDYFSKPVDPAVLKVIIDRAFNAFAMDAEIADSRQEGADTPNLGGVVAASPQMLKIRQLAQRVARSEVGILITGESGTGKEVMARAIHDWSPRSNGPFVAINCAAIPENLLESELFGHEKGAFTGAAARVLGKIELANHGTLFLDEIGDMPILLQAKMLRFLQDKMIERVGGRKPVPVNVRIVAATNRDLKTMMEDGAFREDLFYRLNEIGIAIPALRDRDGDAVLIAGFILKKHKDAIENPPRGFSPGALSAIARYPWPGNVRELENRVRRAMVLASQDMITAEDLDLTDWDENQGNEASLPTLKQIREDAERRAINQTLAATNNNVVEASRVLGVSRPTLYSLIKNLRIRRSTEQD